VLLTNTSQRPWALTAACARVSEAPSFAATAAAHGLVGYGVVATGAPAGTTLGQPKELLARHGAQFQGTRVSAVKQSVIDMDPVGGVRGIPPRGWPV
jgi:hypothetical protein